MSEQVGEAVIKVRTDETGVDTDGAGSRAGKGYTRGFLSGIKGIALGLGAVLAARKLLDFGKESVAEARESQKVGAATTSIIKATGGAANLTASQIGDLSTAISNKSGVDDEAIQSGANLLLAYRNVRNEVGKGNDVFNRATQAGSDLAALGFGSITANARTLGKALNDPVKGMTSLRKVGVQFTADQQAQIKALVASGDTLGAQKIILNQVEASSKGAAAATATYGEKASVAYANLKETIGNLLLPVIDKLERAFVDHIVPAIYQGIDAAKGLGPVFQQLGGFVSGLFSSDAVGGSGGLLDTLRSLAAQALPLLAQGVKAVVPILRDLFAQLLEAGKTILPVMHHTLVTQVLPALQALGGYIVANVLPIFAQLAEIIIHQVVPVLVTLAVFMYGTVYPTVIKIVTAIATQLKPVFDQLITTFRTSVLPTLAKLTQTIRTQLVPALEPIVKRALQVIGVLLVLSAAINAKVLPPMIRIAGFIISTLVPVLATIIVVAVRIIGKVIEFVAAVVKAVAHVGDFADTLKHLAEDGIGRVLTAVTSLPGKIAALAGRMVKAGRTFIGGLFDGILDAAKGAGGLVSRIAGAIEDGISGLLNFIIDKLNDAIPNSLSIPGPDINLPNNPIPHLASGTRSWRGGVTWVGEEGPELVNLPQGSRVWNAQDSADMAGGGPAIYIDRLMPHDYGEFNRQMTENARLVSLGGGRRLVVSGR